MASALAVGPTQPEAFQFIDAKRAKYLPTWPDNLHRGVRIDPAYWPAHQEVAIERFNEWVLS